MDQLKLTIKPEKQYSDETKSIAHSANYDCVIGDWKLGKGVKKLTLEMDASEKPKLIVEAAVDRVDIDSIRDLDLSLIDIETGSKGLTFKQILELTDYRKMKRSENAYNELKRENEKQKTQLMISQVVLGTIVFLLMSSFLYQFFN